MRYDMVAAVVVRVCIASPVVIEAPQSKGVDILRNISLSCLAIGKPQPTVTWTRSDGQALNSTERLTVHNNGSMTIHGLLSLTTSSIHCVSKKRVNFETV